MRRSIAIGFIISIFLSGPLLAADIFIAVGSTFSNTKDFHPLLAVSTDAGKTWKLKTLINPPSNGMFEKISCTGNKHNAICVAVGAESFDGSGQPLLSVSTDSGATWKTKTIPSISNGRLENVSCAGSGNNAVCAATGEYTSTINQKKVSRPLLVVSNDGGNTWSVKKVSGNDLSGGVSCIQNNNVTCTAVGDNYSQPDSGEPLNSPFFIVSNNAGQTWNRVAVPNLPAYGTLRLSGCFGSAPNTTCLATGEGSTKINDYPLLVVSDDGGNTWDVKKISNVTLKGEFNSGSCGEGGSTAICIAAGGDYSTSGGALYPKPFLAVSMDGGNTWNVNNDIVNLPSIGDADITSCTKSGIDKTCIAAGRKEISLGNYVPFILKNTDQYGSVWRTSYPAYPILGSIDAQSCDSDGICIDVGEDHTEVPKGIHAFVSVSKDAGDDWGYQYIPALQATSNFAGVAIIKN